MLRRLQQAWKLFHLPTIHRHLLMSEERHRQAWKCRPLPFCSGRSFRHPVLHRRSHLMAQFEQIKKQYAGYVLLFQVGDFYELYGEDASTWLVSGHIGNCGGWWLSGCCGSVAEHWRLKPEVSWVRLLATASFFTFLYFRLITSKIHLYRKLSAQGSAYAHYVHTFSNNFLRSSTHSNCIHCSSVLCHSLPGEVASKTSLRLTRKNNVFMAGFPVRALDEWQRSLVEAGFQLAICNQIKRM